MEASSTTPPMAARLILTSRTGSKPVRTNCCEQEMRMSSECRSPKRCRQHLCTRKISSCHTFATSRTSLTWKRFVTPISNSAWIHWAEPRDRYWEPINSIYGLEITVVNPTIDSTFSFMTVDYDGKIRMDCSSPYAMARLVGLKDQYQVAFANDPDSDRHGIVTPVAGLMNPNHYLAVAIQYLLRNRPMWRPDASVGKTVVSSSMIDNVVRKLGRQLSEVPVGFKWFVPGLFDGSCCFGGEESAGASFLRRDGT